MSGTEPPFPRRTAHILGKVREEESLFHVSPQTYRLPRHWLGRAGQAHEGWHPSGASPELGLERLQVVTLECCARLADLLSTRVEAVVAGKLQHACRNRQHNTCLLSIARLEGTVTTRRQG